MTKTDLQGATSYHLTTTKTPDGDMSYARIKFPDCVHHYTLDQFYDVMVVEIFDLEGRYLQAGDELDIQAHIGHPSGRRSERVRSRPTKSQAIETCKGMVEWHLNDDYPLWTPSKGDE
jgi:hypothetical protein